MVHYHPYITGYNPLYNPTNQVFFRGSNGSLPWLVGPTSAALSLLMACNKAAFKMGGFVEWEIRGII